ncbi:hypothetical protein ebD96 [Aromatoleum aromaticum EbN1]|uniref:Uncharacterized protein n=1 Tax=Aromatoleum aromaticum (strain DSM 19018 / LMG 30748 / EbN1) TaxID=76114 RepID=Q5P047_AROAE|nr:hypothetical protein ebD96 [Aromatoleum aromaticum EbN1]
MSAAKLAVDASSSCPRSDRVVRLRSSSLGARARCRRRATLMSVHFLGRRVDLGLVVTLDSARHVDAGGRRLGAFGCACFEPPLATERISASLLEPFFGDPEAVMMCLLVFLSLLTVGASALRKGRRSQAEDAHSRLVRGFAVFTPRRGAGDAARPGYLFERSCRFAPGWSLGALGLLDHRPLAGGADRGEIVWAPRR